MVYVYLRSLYWLLSLIPNQINIFYNPKIIVQITFISIEPELGHGLSQRSPWSNGPESSAYDDVRPIGFVHRLSWTVPPHPHPQTHPLLPPPRAPPGPHTLIYLYFSRTDSLFCSFFFLLFLRPLPASWAALRSSGSSSVFACTQRCLDRSPFLSHNHFFSFVVSLRSPNLFLLNPSWIDC